MTPVPIPLWLKASMWIAFFAILGVWSFLWSTFVHALPMWGVYVIDAGVVIAASIYYGRQWLDRRRSAVGRAVVREHHFDTRTRNPRLPRRSD